MRAHQNRLPKTQGDVYSAQSGFAAFGAGLAVGHSGLAAAITADVVGDLGLRATAQQPKLFVGMILSLNFTQALGLYVLIVALVMGES